jgi:hypothetical protein
MRSVIVVYSRSGNTLKVAKALAGTLGAEIVEIRSLRTYRGAFGLLRAGMDSFMRRNPPIEVDEAATGPHDLTVVAAPIWAGRAAAPLMAFLARRRKLHGRVALVLTHGGSDPCQAFDEVERQVGAPLVARLAIREADVKGDDFSAGLAEFVRRVTARVEDRLAARRPRLQAA